MCNHHRRHLFKLFAGSTAERTPPFETSKRLSQRRKLTNKRASAMMGWSFFDELVGSCGSGTRTNKCKREEVTAAEDFTPAAARGDSGGAWGGLDAKLTGMPAAERVKILSPQSARRPPRWRRRGPLRRRSASATTCRPKRRNTPPRQRRGRRGGMPNPRPSAPQYSLQKGAARATRGGRATIPRSSIRKTSSSSKGDVTRCGGGSSSNHSG